MMYLYRYTDHDLNGFTTSLRACHVSFKHIALGLRVGHNLDIVHSVTEIKIIMLTVLQGYGDKNENNSC